MSGLHLKIPGIALTVALATFSNLSSARKLPQIQETGIFAPANIKIDGKLNEWVNLDLQAYNSTNRINYVISNDDHNLYFAMLGLGTRASLKSLQGGISITISSASDKRERSKAKDNIVVTFPIIKIQKDIIDIMAPIYTPNNFLTDSVTNRKQVDSLVLIANTRVKQAAKEIKVQGIEEIRDSVLSVYNSDGIRAAMQFIKRKPVIEIAIPLKYLKLSGSEPPEFSYNLRLPGATSDPALVGVRIDPDPDTMYVMLPTDFWGIYKLAKK